MTVFTQGNSWQVAAARALAGAVLLGVAGFLTVWSQTDDVKILVSAGVGPAVGHLLLRLGIEGYMDRPK